MTIKVKTLKELLSINKKHTKAIELFCGAICEVRDIRKIKFLVHSMCSLPVHETIYGAIF